MQTPNLKGKLVRKQQRETIINISSFRRPTAVQGGEGLTTTPVPLQTNNNTLKSPSSCSSSKIRQAAAPYTAKHV